MNKKRILGLLTAVLVIAMFCGFTSLAAFSKVTGMKQTGSSTSHVEIAWDAVPGASKYKVRYSTDNVNWGKESNAILGPKEMISGLTAGRTYYIQVAAADSKTVGPYSDSFKAVTAPEKVKNVTQTDASTNSVSLKWEQSDGAERYNIYSWANQNPILLKTVTGTSTTITGLKADMEYKIGVLPERSSGSYAAEGLRNIGAKSMQTVGNKPAGLTVKRRPAYYPNSVTVSWNKMSNQTGFEYEVWNAAGTRRLQSDKTTYQYATSKNFSQISENRFYLVRVRSYVQIGTKQCYSEWATAATKANATQVKAKKSGKNIKLTWKKVEGATGYIVYGKQKGSYKKLATVKTMKYTVKKNGKLKLKKNKKYSFYIVAQTKIGGKTYVSSKGKAGSVKYK